MKASRLRSTACVLACLDTLQLRAEAKLDSQPRRMEYLFADDDVLSALRRSIKDKVKKSGIKIVKQLNRKNRHKQTKVLRLKKAVYGAMDAGDSFQLLKEWAFDQAGAKRLFSDSAVYYFQEPGKNCEKGEESCNDEICNDKWFILFSHTDDFGYFRSEN